MLDHISIDILILGTLSHTPSSCIIGKGAIRTNWYAHIGGIVSPSALTTVELAPSRPRVTILVGCVIGAARSADAPVRISEGIGSQAVEDADVIISVVIGCRWTDIHTSIGGVVSIGVIVAETTLHATLIAIISKGILAL